MKLQFFSQISGLAAGLTAATLALAVAPAQAGTIHNGWNYAIDSFDDGYNGYIREDGTVDAFIGEDSNFEFYGMAITEIGGQVYVGIDSNLKLGGQASGGASDGAIHYGDLFFNFTGDSLADADGNLFAVHFDVGNDSGVSEAGVYSNVVGQNVTSTNSGFNHLRHHRNKVSNKGGTANMGDLGNLDAYFQDTVDGNWSNENRNVTSSIASGTKVGGITMLEATALKSLGLDFDNFGTQGKYTFGFSFDRDLLPDGDFIAHLLAECINDGVAIASGGIPVQPEDPASVPEPASVLGLLAVSGLAFKRRQRHA